jgi:hypothetical protein
VPLKSVAASAIAHKPKSKTTVTAIRFFIDSLLGGQKHPKEMETLHLSAFKTQLRCQGPDISCFYRTIGRQIKAASP